MKIVARSELRNRIAIILGTRPGIVKMSPLIRALDKKRIPFFVVHTGQHYSYNMDRIFFEDLDLPEPEYRVEGVAAAKLHGAQTARMLEGVERVLLTEKPRLVVVGGDANTNLAGALAARKLQLAVAHVEAGLRSNDWRMPEEHNRAMIDHISDILFAPTAEARANLVNEAVRGKIYVVGNTIVDAVEENLLISKDKSRVLAQQRLKRKNYLLITVHREENVDNEANLNKVIKLILGLAGHSELPVVFPIHPRTLQRLGPLYEKVRNSVVLTQPLGYLDFLNLLYNAKAVLTDSGGIQEEACILGVPCLTLRDNTERPETVSAGANYLIGLNSQKAKVMVSSIESKFGRWACPYQRGASKKIVHVLAGAVRGG